MRLRPQTCSRLMARSITKEIVSITKPRAAASAYWYSSRRKMMSSGVISVSMYLLPAMKTTDPYSPTARAKASVKPVSSAGNKYMKTEITPLLIIFRLEEYDYAGAAALGFVMLAISFVMLLAINLLQVWGCLLY